MVMISPAHLLMGTTSIRPHRTYRSRVASWRWCTFPGPGHHINAGPWTETEGWDRSEHSICFAVHPQDKNFMLRGTDFGLAVCRDGHRFGPTKLAKRSIVSISMHPKDANQAFVLTKAGWYRTRDKGVSWTLMFAPPSVAGNTLPNDTDTPWGKRLLVVDPSDPTHIWVVVWGAGIYRSIDDGASFHQSLFSPGALENVFTIEIAQDGSKLYALASDATMDPDALPDLRDLIRWGLLIRGTLWRCDEPRAATPSATQVNAGLISEFALDPTDPSRGYVVVDGNGSKNALHRFALDGTTFEETPVYVIGANAIIRLVKVNPWNRDHVILCGGGNTGNNLQLAIVRSTNATDVTPTFHELTKTSVIDNGIVRNNYIQNWYDYAPINHASYNYWIPMDGNKLSRETVDVIDFVPDAALTVRTWGLPSTSTPPSESIDGGATFLPFGFGHSSFKRPSDMSAVAVAGKLYIAVSRIEYGFVISDGTTWRGYSHRNSPFVDPDAPQQVDASRAFLKKAGYGVSIDPRDPNIIVVLWSTNPTKIYRCTNFLADPANPNWLRVGDCYDDLTAPGGLPDGDMRERFHRRLFRSSTDPDFLHAYGCISTDNGATWSAAPYAGVYVVLAMSAQNGSILVAKEYNGSNVNLHVSLNAGADWIRLPSNNSVNLDSGYCVAIDPRPEHDPTINLDHRLRIYVAGRDGIEEFRATNESGSEGNWTTHNSGMITQEDGSVATSHLAISEDGSKLIVALNRLINDNQHLADCAVYTTGTERMAFECMAVPPYRGLPPHFDIGPVIAPKKNCPAIIQSDAGQFSLEM